MPKIIKETNDPHYTVIQRPMEATLPSGDRILIPDQFVNINEKTGKPIGTCSKRYKLYNNDDVINVAEDAFKALGLKWSKRKFYVYDGGRQFRGVYDFNDHTNEVRREDRTKGMQMGMRLSIQNSFDGVLRLNWLLGILRLACLNGMVTTSEEEGMTKKHCGSDLSLEFVTAGLKNIIARFDNAVEHIQPLYGHDLTQAQGQFILNHLQDEKVISKRIREGIVSLWNAPSRSEDEDRNLFNLYNAGTEYLTHQYRGHARSLELNGRWYQTLRGAATTPSRLAELVEPIEDEAVTVAE